MKIYRQEGAGVFFRGLNATLCRAFLCNGAIFTVYEFSHKLLKNMDGHVAPAPAA